VGGRVAQVVATRHPDYAVGDIVLGYGGWQEYAVSNGVGLRTLGPAAAPISTALGVLGTTEMAYVPSRPISRIVHVPSGLGTPRAPCPFTFCVRLAYGNARGPGPPRPPRLNGPGPPPPIRRSTPPTIHSYATAPGAQAEIQLPVSWWRSRPTWNEFGE
jgi:hypothetical protein